MTRSVPIVDVVSRREFLGAAFATAATAATSHAFAAPPPMKLSFMTFVCPEWPIEKIVALARRAGYDGVEIRVDAGHRHGISSATSAESRRAVRKAFRDEGVEVAAVATSVQFASPKAEDHKKHLEAAKANLDLASDLGAAVVRIFAGGGIPKLTPAAAEQVAAAFDEVGDYAKATGVCPVLECGHDIIKGADEAAEVIRRVRTKNFGALWNDSKMDDATFAALKDRIRHFHVHDEVLDPQNANLVDTARRMKSIGYRGYVSLEIIWGKNVPEQVLSETAARLRRQIDQGFRAS